MYHILSENTDSFFNLATEEYLLKNSNQNFFILWRSAPSVIVGKHQNAYAEIDLQYVLQNNIKIARRLTGGGTVVHDMGNLNFTFIMNGEKGKLVDFKKYLKPIIRFLEYKGIAAFIGEKNDIRVGEYKISGNAEHVFKQRTLHHGTLLFNSDLNQLKSAIHINKKKYFDKAVQSNRSGVVNILDLLPEKLAIEDFEQELCHFVNQDYQSEAYVLGTGELDVIEGLVKEKFSKADWVFGYSPKYSFVNKMSFKGDSLNISFRVEKGILSSVVFDLKGEEDAYCADLQKQLNGSRHLFPEVYKSVEKVFPKWEEHDLRELTFQFF